nr:GtrA family protein [uncultured Duganella sp.]
MRRDTALGVKFLTFGCIGGVVFVFDASCFWLLLRLTGSPVAARALSVGLAMTLSWWLNRTFTFRAAGPVNWAEMAKFLLSQLPGAGVNAAVSVAAFQYLALAENNAWIAVAFGSCAGLAANFLMAHLFVFKKSGSAP